MRDRNTGPTVDEIRLAMTQLAGVAREARDLREQVKRLEHAAAEREATVQAHMERRWQAEQRAEKLGKALHRVLALNVLCPAEAARLEEVLG